MRILIENDGLCEIREFTSIKLVPYWYEDMENGGRRITTLAPTHDDLPDYMAVKIEGETPSLYGRTFSTKEEENYEKVMESYDAVASALLEKRILQII